MFNRTLREGRPPSKKRNARGGAAAELGPVLFFLFVGIGFPLLCYSTMLFRCVFAYYAARDSCYKAAKSSSYSTAVTNGGTALTTDLTNIPGVTAGTPTISIISQPLAGGNASSSNAHLNSVDTNTFVYFIRESTAFTIQPLLPSNGTWRGMHIPGMTTAYPLTIHTQFYVENPQGLLN
jgi:hypothetical protein